MTEIAERPVAAAGPRPWRLSARARKLLLLLHIASGGAWLGIDVVLGVLVVTALAGGDSPAAAVSTAIAAIATWPLVVVGALCLLSGVLLGLGSKYGLVRYWWVLVKLVLNVVLLSLVILVLSPGVARLGSRAEQALASGAAFEIEAQLLFPPLVSSTALIVAMALSVFKPWPASRGAARPARPGEAARGRAPGCRASRG